MKGFIIFILLSLFMITVAIPQTDWPIFRGNQSLQGVAAGNIGSRLNLIWVFKTDDIIKSSPVIWQQKVYVGSADSHVYAIGLYDGKKIWQFATDDEVEASPLFAYGNIYIGSVAGTMYAIDALNGEQKWQYSCEYMIIGSANWFEAKDGKRILFGSYDNTMYCLDAVSGKKVWGFTTNNYINGAPAINNNLVVFGGCDAFLYIINAENGKQAGKINLQSYIAASAGLADENAYIGNYASSFICADLNKQQVKWRYGDEEHGYPFFASPAVNNDYVIVGSRDKKLHCLDRRTGESVWAFLTGGDVDSSPVICDDKVVFGSNDGMLYIVDLEQGKLVWSYEIGEAITSSPAVAGDMVVVGAEDGYIYGFRSP
jgi:outer membrane protein assembly factor BamB